MIAVLALVTVAAGTWALRVAPVTLLDVNALPSVLREALDDVGPAMFAALIVTALAGGEGHAGLRVPVSEIASLGVAGIVALRTDSLPWALVAALATNVVLGAL